MPFSRLYRNGCTWRNLPSDFPPYGTVSYYYHAWRRSGLLSNPWYTRRRKKGGKAFKKVEQVDGQEKAVYARVQGQSGPGKLSTRYDDRSSAQEVWGLQLHDSSLAAGVSNQSALALR